MIFYGTKGAHLKSEKVSGIKCSYCEQQSPHTVSIFARYAYLYWIPVFPLGKKGVSECDNCKRTLEPSDMNEQLKLAYKNVKSNSKTPIWHWSGLILIVALVGFVIYSSNQHKKDALVYINEPQVGDVYEYKPDDYYSTLKVVSISQDSVFVISNNYEIERQSRLYKIDKASNYTTEPYGISKEDIKGFYASRKILDVNRN